MKIELLYFDGCPSHERLYPRLERLLREAGVSAPIELRRVESAEAADAERFLGSPSLRIDGHDVEPGADERDDFGLKCRLYRSGAEASGLPPDAWISAALARASIRIPEQLAAAVEEDDDAERLEWLDALPQVVHAIARQWKLELGEPYLPGGQCAWVAPVRDASGQELVLKVGWRHREAEHEADALRFWDGEGAVRCFAAQSLEDTSALLLERCAPGVQLKESLPEPEQDEVIAGLLRRLWARPLPDDHPFGSLQDMCDRWAECLELAITNGRPGADPGLARAGAAMLRELARTADPSVLLSTDLHAENVLSAEREPWLAIDPKPFVGDPAYDPVQHMLNCGERLASDPAGLATRMAELCELDPERVRLWLFARCAQESPNYPTLAQPARRLAD